MLLPRPEMRTAVRRRASAVPVTMRAARDRRRAAHRSSTTSPIRLTRSPSASKARWTAFSLLARGDHHHADAAIEGAQHLGSAATGPVAASQRNTGGSRQARRDRARRRGASGSTRGMFSGKPPPVICASALTPARRARSTREQRASHRAASASAAPRPSVAAGAKGAGVAPGRARSAPRCGAPARSRWNASPMRQGRARHRPPRCRCAARARRARPRRPRSPRDRSRPCVKPRHLRGLAADQRAAGFAAAGGDAGDDAAAPSARDRACRSRNSRGRTSGSAPCTTRSLTHIATRSMPTVSCDSGFDRDLELGADAVGGGDQDRILEARRLQVEEAAETADPGVRARPRASRAPAA